jgi:hypothetical protein
MIPHLAAVIIAASVHIRKKNLRRTKVTGFDYESDLFGFWQMC